MAINYGNEYKKMLGRNGRPYSDAHIGKYRVISELLKKKPANILEIGPGTGEGIHRLIKRKCIKKYLGIDAVKDCADFLKKEFKSHLKNNIKITNFNWIDAPEEDIKDYFSADKADFVLCIEVIEHNPYDLERYLVFLKKAHKFTKNTFFYSTPNSLGDRHGKLTNEESMTLLHKAGFKEVSKIVWQGTPFYICNP
jgi:2-polyprenyl-3-methyl-5-hydroxy-6-metoxy-1,4-benzoquinol methylase